MSRTWIRTFFAFGFGSVTIHCEASQHGRIMETKLKPGFMIGFIILNV